MEAGLFIRRNRNEEFQPWHDARIHLESLSESWQITPISNSNEKLSAYQLVFRLPGCANARLHHAAFPRMIGKTVIRANEDWKSGLHSPLTADYHFEERIGLQSFGLFPPFLALSENSPTYLIGPLDEQQTRCSYSWRVEGDDLVVEVQFDFWGLKEGFEIPADWLGTPVMVQELQQAKLAPELFSSYHRWLTELDRHGYRSEHFGTNSLFWGSWNDGHFRNIDHDRILSNARYLKEHAPNVEWIQIDDGWAPPSSAVSGSLEDGCATLGMSDFGVFYKPEYMNTDPRFPKGLKGIADDIKEQGLKPMIWLTTSVNENSPLYKEHPEWFLQDCRLHFVPEMRFLDFSQEPVRDYARHVFQTAFNEWGFQGCKLDFWSMGFDQHDVWLKEAKQTATECLNWLSKTLREYVGEEGLLLYCIDLAHGIPFRGRYFDQFRYYADSEGSCSNPDMMREQALWAAMLTGLYGVQRYWIPDGDGLGLWPHIELPENRYQLWCALLLGSGTLTESCGWLDKAPDSPRKQLLHKVLPWARQGKSVSLPGYNFQNDPPNPPQIWVRHDSPNQVLIAVTNWSTQTLRVDPRDFFDKDWHYECLFGSSEIEPESGAVWIGREP